MLGTVVSGAEMLGSAFCIGIMIAMLSSVAQAVIIRRAPKERYGVAVSTYNVFVDLSYAIGPVVNGFVIGAVGYGGNYVLMAFIGVAGLVLYLLLHGIPPSLQEGACRDAYFRSDVADAVFHGVCFNPRQQSGGNAFSLVVLVDEHGVQVAVVADGGDAHDASFGIAGGDEV